MRVPKPLVSCNGILVSSIWQLGCIHYGINLRDRGLGKLVYRLVEVLTVKTTYGKSSALNLMVGSLLTLGPSFKVECGP